MSRPGVCGASAGCDVPDRTASVIAQSAMVWAMVPIVSSVLDSEKAPVVGTRPEVGLNPTAPERADGMRIEPPVSLPMAISAMPSTSETTAPEEDPPGARLR